MPFLLRPHRHGITSAWSVTLECRPQISLESELQALGWKSSQGLHCFGGIPRSRFSGSVGISTFKLPSRKVLTNFTFIPADICYSAISIDPSIHPSVCPFTCWFSTKTVSQVLGTHIQILINSCPGWEFLGFLCLCEEEDRYCVSGLFDEWRG